CWKRWPKPRPDPRRPPSDDPRRRRGRRASVGRRLSTGTITPTTHWRRPMAQSAVTNKNDELLARAERAMAGGNRLPDGTDFVVSHGKGCRVWDVDGREYLDFVLGSGPMIL